MSGEMKRRIARLEKQRRQKRGDGPFEIYIRGGLLPPTAEIVRACVCDQDAQTWRYFERQSGESELVFQMRVRAARAENGRRAFITWNGLREPREWMDDPGLGKDFSTNSSPALLNAGGPPCVFRQHPRGAARTP
jgi:hypothetical protein